MIAVTRRPDQASQLSDLLRAAGAEVIEAPTIKVGPVENHAKLDEALCHLDRYDWLVLTSANGVDAMFDRLEAFGLRSDHLARVKVAAIGPATARRLRDQGHHPELVPPEAVGEAMAQSLIAQGITNKRVLLLVADIARPQLAEALRAAGALCDSLAVYRTVCPAALPAAFLQRFDRGEVDWITLTSPSSFVNLLALLGPERAEQLRSIKLASIGPVTTRAIRDAGHEAAAEADPHEVSGLVSAVITASART